MILVIDNYDSFTYNLVQYLGQWGADVEVRRNDEVTVQDVRSMRPEGILLSPGPGTPNESGVCVGLLEWALSTDERIPPVFGVCLGHQTMGQVGGGTVDRARNIMHGKASMVRHDGRGLMEGMPNPFRAIRYHSLIVRKESVPAGFVITATSEDDGEVMGIRHTSKPIEGVQFHPESVLTEDGFRIVGNFVRLVRGASAPV
ncbi:MAG: aminodeoxychorismate/anthranilate synthase component II [Fimbriimonadaceae bacterium]|nr:aminodeoxychorismate/anthranilate synthase component II [Fimbriimonadaceae bacterium]